MFNSYYNYDPDVETWLGSVATVSGRPTLTEGAKVSVDTSIKSLKSAGFWSGISQLLLFAGPSIYQGCLIPMKGETPTILNGGSLTYSAAGSTPGFKGNASTVYVNTGRTVNQQSQNNAHYAAYVTAAPTAANASLFGGGFTTNAASLSLANSPAGAPGLRLHTGAQSGGGTTYSTGLGLAAFTRLASTSFSVRTEQTTSSITNTSTGVSARQIFVLARGGSTSNDTTPTNHTDARFLCYHCGAGFDQSGSLTLAALETIWAQLQTDLNAIGSLG